MAKGTGLIARALGGAAMAVDPLHGSDVRKRPASAAVHGALPTALPVTALPSPCSQVGPA
jgi:hypothetical protein